MIKIIHHRFIQIIAYLCIVQLINQQNQSHQMQIRHLHITKTNVKKSLPDQIFVTNLKICLTVHPQCIKKLLKKTCIEQSISSLPMTMNISIDPKRIHVHTSPTIHTHYFDLITFQRRSRPDTSNTKIIVGNKGLVQMSTDETQKRYIQPFTTQGHILESISPTLSRKLNSFNIIMMHHSQNLTTRHASH